MSDHLSGRLALFADVAKRLGPEFVPVRITLRDRVRLYVWLWRLRRQS